MSVIETQVRQRWPVASQMPGGGGKRGRDGAINCVMSVIPCKESCAQSHCAEDRVNGTDRCMRA